MENNLRDGSQENTFLKFLSFKKVLIKSELSDHIYDTFSSNDSNLHTKTWYVIGPIQTERIILKNYLGLSNYRKWISIVFCFNPILRDHKRTKLRGAPFEIRTQQNSANKIW